MEVLYRFQEKQNFYQRFNAPRNDFVSLAEICNDKDGSVLTEGRELLEKLK